MRPEYLSEANEWLTRAERDMLAAERVLQDPVALSETAAFHSQQAAEKALKGFLTANGQTFPKTHELVPLLTRCRNIDGDFARFLQAARTLTPYAVRFRYPGGPLEPGLAEAREAIRLAGEIVEFVRGRLGTAGLP